MLPRLVHLAMRQTAAILAFGKRVIGAVDD
jgi:hypothetical protein